MSVRAIGGLFWRARDPVALKAWYREHLGVGGGLDATGQNIDNEWVWATAGGPVVFEPFGADTDYFAADRQFMINFRVDELDTLLERLRGTGIAVETRDEWDAVGAGRFARIHDPEGLAIELWEPPADG